MSKITVFPKIEVCDFSAIRYLRLIMRERTRRFIRYVMPAVVYAAAIFTISSIPRLQPPSIGLSWDDKVYHFIEYVGFSLLLYRAFYCWAWTRAKRMRLLLTILVGALTGAADELHQIYTPSRAAQVSDWLADFAGVLFSVILVLVNRLRKTSRRTGS